MFLLRVAYMIAIASSAAAGELLDFISLWSFVTHGTIAWYGFCVGWFPVVGGVGYWPHRPLIGI